MSGRDTQAAAPVFRGGHWAELGHSASQPGGNLETQTFREVSTTIIRACMCVNWRSQRLGATNLSSTAGGVGGVLAGSPEPCPQAVFWRWGR